MFFAARIRPALACSVLVALALTPPARADEPFFSIVAVQRTSGWYFEIEGDTDPGVMPSATVTPPGGSPVALTCTSTIGEDSCYATDPLPEDPGFESLAALLDVHPAGAYLLSIAGGALTAHLDFAPVAPDGSVLVSSPADGAVSVDGTPTITYTHDCSSCGFLFFEIDGLGATDSISLETTRIGTPPLAAAGTVPYSELKSSEGPKPAALPNGSYRLSAAAGRGELVTASFDQGGAFQYGSGAERTSTSIFTVPEASAGSAAVASLAILAARARRRAQLVLAIERSAISSDRA